MATEGEPAPDADETGEPAQKLSFMERARQVAGQAATTAAKAGAEMGGKAAKAAGDAGEKAAATIRDPATKARAQSALRKAKRGFTTALERIDPKILADVVVRATSLQEKANASLKERGSAYRIGEITIGASIPPSIQFSIERIEDPANELKDSRTLIANAGASAAAAVSETIVTLDGTAVENDVLDELEDEE